MTVLTFRRQGLGTCRGRLSLWISWLRASHLQVLSERGHCQQSGISADLPASPVWVPIVEQAY